MALGTPVAAAVAYSTNGGSSVSPAYPSGILASDVVLMFVGQKPSTANGGTVTTPSGWTLREELTAAGGYGTTLGADTGNTNLRVYTWDTPVAGQTGNLSITIGTNNVSWAFMVRIPTDGGTDVFGSADGSQATTPTSPLSVALTNGATATNFKTGDRAIWAMCVPTDVGGGATFSSHTISATGATFNTPAELNEPSSGTGNDIGGMSAWASVTAGSSTTAPTIGANLAGTLTNIRGPVVLLRVRELPFIDAASTSFTITGQNTTNTITRALNAEAGAFTYTGQDATLTKTTAPKEINAEVGSFTYTGQDASFTAARAVNAAAGSFSYTGQNATLAADRTTDAEDGSFVITGQDATVAAARNVNAEAGAFSYTGQDASLIYQTAPKEVNAQAGVFTITGQDATLSAGLALNAEAGAFTYTGEDATLEYVAANKELNAEAGSFVISGQDATFDAELPTDAGAFNITGQDAYLYLARSINAQFGAFGEANPYVDLNYVDPGYATGLTAALGYGRAFNAAAGSFTYTGDDATLYIAYLYPPESDVRAGVHYGPGGIYVGTLTVGAGESIIRLRSFTERY